MPAKTSWIQNKSGEVERDGIEVIPVLDGPDSLFGCIRPSPWDG